MGGAAVQVVSGTFNMYGGIMENNIVATEYTVVKNDDGTESSLETAGCGGAVYNRGNVNMYGGIIRTSEALRGGGIYNDKFVYLFAGTIADNYSYSYGGAISSSSGRRSVPSSQSDFCKNFP
jgi:hypothetical protein